MIMKEEKVIIPLDVAPAMREAYTANYRKLTHGTGRLMLFAGDQKAEHLNDDFYGPGVAPDDANPEHLFRIASKARIGVFASQMGLIARYGMDYPQIPYLVKLNSKSNVIKTAQRDPQSVQWQTLEQVARFREGSGLNILGVGFTIYPGSEFESDAYSEVARLVFEAHQQGLVTVVWAYPRGKGVANELDPHLVAGVAGMAATLGTDFVKVNFPELKNGATAAVFKEAVQAAGRTKVICAGGKEAPAEEFLKLLHDQIHLGGAAGNATGRNIHMRPLAEAVSFCNAISAVTLDDASVAEAMKLYHK
jgi:fructose-bisphosphate aldolase/6-deoxy-5-ketofructose 1-phosphate synthase